MASIKWIPIECNPEVMNRFLERLGVSPAWSISDVISLDDDMLSMIPEPSLAFLLLFPISQNHEQYNAKKLEESNETGAPPSKIYYMRQTIKNACGTVALLHALSNNFDELNVDKESTLAQFLELSRSMSPEERGKELENDESIGVAHEFAAQEGQTEAPSADADVNLHYTALVNINGTLYELDGRVGAPLVHGSTSKETFVKDAARVCKEFMQRDPDNMKFMVLSLGPTQ